MKVLLGCCLSACLFLFFSSCHKKDASPFLTIQPATTLLDSTVGTKSRFIVSSNIQWKLSVSPASAASWLQVDKMSGENTADVILTVTGKNNSADENVVITASSADNSNSLSATLIVSQKGSLTANRYFLSIQGSANSYDSFTVTSNGQWKITAVPSWLLVDTTVKPAGKTMVKVIAAAANNTMAPLKGSLTVTPAGNNEAIQPVVITVQQEVNWGVQSFSPQEGVAGAEVTLTGFFGSNPTVYLSGLQLPIKSSSSNQIVVTIPSNATGGGPFAVNFDKKTWGSSKSFILHNGWNPRNQVTSFGPQYTIDGISFVYNGSIYFGLGNPSSTNIKGGANIIYKLDTVTFALSPAFTIPSTMPIRSYPFIFTLNNKVYIGGGHVPGNPYSPLHDVWELDPANGNWRQMTSLPNTGFQNMGYASGSIAYVQSIQDSRYPSGSTMYMFSISSPADLGTWSFEANVNLTKTLVSCFTLKNVGFFGGGTEFFSSTAFSTSFYRYSPAMAALVNLSAVPVQTSESYFERTPSFSIGDKGYILCQKRKLYEYDPVTDAWALKSSLPYFMHFATAIGNRIFAWDNAGRVFEYIP